MIGSMVAAMALLTAAQEAQGEVVDEAYSPGNEAVDLCGVSGANFAGFLSSLANDGDFREENSNDTYIVMVSDEGPLRILAVARPRDKAYPMAHCRRFLPNPDGTSRIESSMHCKGDKADCDEVFLSFYNHDQAILRSMGH